MRAALTHGDNPATLALLFRRLTVMAWGRNVEGQCGAECGPLLSRPTPILELHDEPVASLAAGKLSSAAVMKNGEVWTFGCARAGKLGHGSAEPAAAPARVESLVGRTAVVIAALGDAHSLFLDAEGHVWACGDNKEGQCGMGTPIEVLAAQYRRAWHQAHQPLMQSLIHQARPSPGPASDVLAGAGDDRFARFLRAAADEASARHTEQQRGAAAARAQLRMVLRGTGPGAGAGAYAGMGVGGGAAGGGGGGGMSLLPALGGIDWEAHLQGVGLAPGQSFVPARLGRDTHPLAQAAAGTPGGVGAGAAGGVRSAGRVASSSAWSPGGGAASGAPHGGRAPGCCGLVGRRVVSVAAGRHLSAAVTVEGELFTWGACFNGALGQQDASWSTHAAPVSPTLAAAIGSAGGATSVVAGGTFCAALTASGRAFVFGTLPGGSAAGAARRTARAGAVEVLGLPPLVGIAAGQQHLLLTDGEAVWAVGRWMGADGEEAGSACAEAPALVLRCRGAGVARVAAGAHVSAAVTGDGRLMLWGRIMDRHHGEGLLRRFGSADGADADAVPWGWSGFGGAQPALVEELWGVRDVALGGWHALALVD